MDDLPIEWLEQILHHVSTTDLHRSCIRVNKQWNQAANYVIRNRRTLRLIDKYENVPPDEDLDTVTISWRTDSHNLLKSLLRMTGVKELIIKNENNFVEESLVLVKELSATIQSLLVNRLPLGHELVFEELRELDCYHFNCSPDDVRVPRLTSLRSGCFDGLDMLKRLSVDLLQEVSLSPLVMDMSDLIEGLSRFQNLRHLRLNFSCEWMEVPDSGLLLRLFSAFDHLLSFSVTAGCFIVEENGDASVAALVVKNAGLEDITAVNFSLTDLSLTPIARLEHLTRLQVGYGNTIFTTDGILSLLTGRSRHLIQEIDICLTSGTLDANRINDELFLMQEESGRELHVQQVTEEIVRLTFC